MLKYLLEKEFKQIRRNAFLPKLIVGLPIFALLFLPLAANFEVKNIAISLVDHDQSPYSHKLVQKIQVSHYFHLTHNSDNYFAALRAIELWKADIILEIPAGFEKDLVSGKGTKVLIAANAVNETKGGLGSAYLGRIIQDYSEELSHSLSPPSQLSGLDIVPEYRYNPLLRYPVFMVPAIMVMLLAMICGFLPALNIVMEKESGTIEQINVTPVSRISFILSKLIPYWVIGFIVLTLCFVIAALFHGLFPKGNILTIYLFASLFVLAFSGLGLVISNYASSVQQAMFMIFFFVITFIFISGLYTPVDNMPEWAQILSIFSPLKYLIQVMRLVYLKGSGLMDLLPQFLALFCFALFFNGWAVLNYRKTN